MEIELTSANYEGEVLKSDKPVLVDFWASWCGPCKMLAPTIAQLAEEYNGRVKVCKLNVDDEGAIAAQNAIVSIPTVIFFVNGKSVKKIVGAHSLDEYEDAIEELL
jgi:thioredoxin 1